MICKIRNYVLKDSNDNTYKFCLEPNKSITLEQYIENISTKTTIKNSVLDYSVDIDSFDRIHLAYVTLDGILKYCLFNYPSSEKPLTGVKSKNFEITNITIKIISNDVHIFYMLKNQFNINKCSLHHGCIKDSSFSIKNIGYTSLTKNSIPYSIDIYKNNLYLFYPSIEPNEYCIDKLNLSFNMWSNIEKNIQLLNVSDADFLINSMGTCIIFFNYYSNKITTTFVKFKDFNNLNNSWSENISIVSINSEITLPSVAYKNNSCFVFWMEDSLLYFKKSSYGTTKWSAPKTISLNETIFISKYIKYVLNEPDCKNNYLYLINNCPPYSILDHKVFRQTDSMMSEYSQQKFNPLNGPLNETLKIISKNTNLNLMKDNKDMPLIDNLTYDNNLIEKLQEDLFKNDKKISSLEENLKEYDNLIKDLKEKLHSKDKEISFLNNNLLDSEVYKDAVKIKEVELENIKSRLHLKESEIKNLDASYKNLVTEKESVIENLKNKILELEKFINENKNKSFFNFFK